jgi:hypothetical protein
MNRRRLLRDRARRLADQAQRAWPDRKKPAARARPPSLLCGSSDTKASTSLFCVRMDTATRRQAGSLGSIPVSGVDQGGGRAGQRYQLVCVHAGDGVGLLLPRLDTESGEPPLVSCPLGVIPENAARHEHGGSV